MNPNSSRPEVTASPPGSITEEAKQCADQANQPDLCMGEASTSVSLTSFMTVVVFFFIGLLLTSGGGFEAQVRLRVPLILLFISAIGFFYSTLVYANASGEVARLGNTSFNRQMSIANIVSEYFGVYCLIFSVPLTILAHSPDRVLAVVILIVNIFGFYLYHHFGYSILDRYFSQAISRGVVVLLLLLNALAFFSFGASRMTIFHATSLLLLGVIVVVFVISLRRTENKKSSHG